MSTTTGRDSIGALAEWLPTVGDADIPAQAYENARLQVLDHLGCAVLGADSRASDDLRATTATLGRADESTVILGGRRSSAFEAALVNAASISMTELTVGIGRAHVHPGTQAIPVALAEAERIGASGRDVLRAIVVGYEVMIRLGWSMSHVPGEPLTKVRPQLMLRGWYTPSILGGFGAVATVAVLRGFDASRVAQAFGICGNLAPTALYSSAKSGAMVKSLSEGWAAALGLFAADLADRGFTGVPRIADELFPLLVGDASRIDFARIDEDLGDRWEFLDFGRNQTMFSASRTSSITDCAFQMRDEHDIDPASIAEIIVDTTSRFKLLDDRTPANPHAGKFSIPYCVAQVFIGRRREGMLDEAFTEDAFERLDWRGLAARVRVDVEPAFDAAFETHPRVSSPSRITVVLRDGTRIRHQVDGYFGLSGNPEVDPVDFDRKFRHLADRRLAEGAADRIVDLVHGFDELAGADGIRSLMAVCRDRRPEPLVAAR